MSRRHIPALAAAALVVVLAASGCQAPASPPASAPASGAQAQAPGAAVADNLDAAGFADLVAQPGVVVVDVRTPEEFNAGHLQGAININVESPDFATKIAELDADATYAIYCRSGNRSTHALRQMRQAGLAKSSHLSGGIIAWEANGGQIVVG